MSKVLVIKYSGERWNEFPDSGIIQTMIETGITSLTGLASTGKAVNSLLPDGRIGIKINCLTGGLNSTPVKLVDGLTNLLKSSDFEENQIIIWERTGRELERAGYELNASSFGRRCFGTDTNGIGYERNFYSSGQVNSLVSKIVTEYIDYNINLPRLKDHSIAGLSGCLKNMFGAINNPNKYHGDNCDPYAADISNLEPIKSKHRLSIIDAIKVQYSGGPGFDSRYFDDYGGLIISADPVAADSVGLKIIEQLRKSNGLPSLEQAKRPAKYLQTAERIGLGVADFGKIDLKTISIDRDGSIANAELF